MDALAGDGSGTSSYAASHQDSQPSTAILPPIPSRSLSRLCAAGNPAAPAWLSWQEMALAQQAPAAAMQPQGAVQLGFAQHPSSGEFVFGAG